ncbi:hypothetical protein ABZ439_19050 [Streptomyces sp. NPDC005840]|jgi:hypothetical protein|uniref:hypothetical protein n=1 Tax=unclassified Streptomyces TaxID=2593676 RepID=UPI00081B6DEF|nr:hypothetical protein [Streptomyces sp. SID4950]SCE36558.1 hypothetical protein GA0115242_13403 [Streptomyces sp. SolWspMP-5a-2]
MRGDLSNAPTRGQRDVTTTATEFESDLVDLSRCGLHEVMTLHDPLFVDALDVLVRHLGERPTFQSNSGAGNSPYLAADCDGAEH